MGENYEMNSQARRVIENARNRQAALKKQAVEELLAIVNGICEQEGTAYFAAGDLLTLGMDGTDSDPERMEYMVVMMREDYDRFMHAAKACAQEKAIEVLPMYDADGRLVRMHSYVSMFRESRKEDGYANVHLMLRIDPYEIVPENPEKREAFERVLVENSRKLLAESMAVANARIDRKLEAKAVHKLYVNQLRSRTKQFRMQCHRYADVKKPVLTGRVEHVIHRPHPIKSIFPIGRLSFGNTYMLVPADPKRFMVQSKELLDQKIYEHRLEALKAFDGLCEKNGLTYVVMGMLSSDITHYGSATSQTKGYLWQIGLLRNDYESVVKLLAEGKEQPSLALLEHERDYPQVHNNRVGFVMKNRIPQDPWMRSYPIELYPLDAVSDSYEAYHDTISAAIRSYRKLRAMINGEKAEGYDPRQGSSDTWIEYDRMQQERIDMMQETVGSASESQTKRVYTIYSNRPRTYLREDLFPTVRRTLDGISLSCAANPYLWHEPKDDDYTEYLTGKRTVILKKVDRICSDLGVDYFAIANLLVGASIYHDYVPGSNNTNLDLGLLRKDYELLLVFLRRNAKDYGLQLNEFRDENKKYPMRTVTVSHIGGEFSEVIIRLLPFDKVPEDFYLYHAFIDDMTQRNRDLNDLVMSHTYTGPVNHTPVRNPVTRELIGQVRRRAPNAEKAVESVRKAEYIFTADPMEKAREISRLAQMFNDDDRTDTYARVALDRSKKIPGKELFPLRRVPFRDMMLSCPGDYSVWQPMLNKELERQVACIQKADLLLLQELDRVCQELGIGYFVCGGTMLGYMRHKGFIPWDDDVDVAMLRADYDRFLKEAGPLLKERFFLQTRETDPNIPYLFSKIRLDDTEYITEYNEDRDFHKGICLDIFPFDYLPDRPENCQEYIKEVIALSKAHHRIANRQFAIPDEEPHPRNAKERAYVRAEKAELKRVWSKDLRKSQKAYIDAATRYNAEAKEKGYTIVASFIPDFTWIDLGDLLPYQRGMFQGVEVSVPKRPDVFLTMQYGDFMQLPPKHQQVAHRLVRWSTWEESWDDDKEET